MKKIILTILIFINSNCFADSGKITVNSAWARPVESAGKNSAIYMVISNDSAEDDNLINVSSSVAKQMQIHKTVSIENISTMVSIAKLLIPANSSVTLQPKNLHIMLIRANKALKPNDKFFITLSFEKAGDIKVEVETKNMNSTIH